MKVIGSREFNQDVSAAKRLARVEPVFITDRGRPTHVLMSIQTFRQMSGQRDTIVDLLAMPGARDGDLPPPDSWAARVEP
jgi:hypothetical protein